MNKSFIPYIYNNFPHDEMIKKAADFYDIIKRRRTIREFSSLPIPADIIKNCIQSAGTAPSGANMQPWHFVVVTNPFIKRQIRETAEKEEYEFYNKRATDEWLEALSPLGTDFHKPFLETAPYLIVIFSKVYGINKEGKKVKHYYVNESVGIATGILISSLHYSGVATLTHTPSPMNFLNNILNRPANEKAYLILVCGYPAEGVMVPDISRKSLEEICEFV